MSRENVYPENPHYPGTVYAAWWDLGESFRLAGVAILDAYPWLRRALRYWTQNGPGSRRGRPI